jgi:hypothetical protein
MQFVNLSVRALGRMTHRTGPPPMRALTSISRGPLLVYLDSTWNTPMWKPSACEHTHRATGFQIRRSNRVVSKWGSVYEQAEPP